MTLLAGAAVEYTDSDEKEFVANLGFVIITDTTECLLLDGKDSMYPSVQQGFRAATVVDDNSQESWVEVVSLLTHLFLWYY